MPDCLPQVNTFLSGRRLAVFMGGKPFDPQAFSELLADRIAMKSSVRAFAKRLGITAGAITKWTNGDVPDGWRRFRQVCEDLDISADELLGLDVRSTRASPSPDQAAPVPQEWIPLVANVAAGEPMVDPRSEAEDWYAFKSKWVRQVTRRSGTPIDRLFAVKVARGAQGESMTPTIRPGASLVVDPGPESGLPLIDDGMIYLCKPGGGDGWTVKRAWLAEKSRYLVLKGDNPTQGAIVEDMKGRRLRDVVVGKVIYIGQEES